MVNYNMVNQIINTISTMLINIAVSLFMRFADTNKDGSVSALEINRLLKVIGDKITTLINKKE